MGVGLAGDVQAGGAGGGKPATVAYWGSGGRGVDESWLLGGPGFAVWCFELESGAHRWQQRDFERQWAGDERVQWTRAGGGERGGGHGVGVGLWLADQGCCGHAGEQSVGVDERAARGHAHVGDVLRRWRVVRGDGRQRRCCWGLERERERGRLRIEAVQRGGAGVCERGAGDGVGIGLELGVEGRGGGRGQHGGDGFEWGVCGERLWAELVRRGNSVCGGESEPGDERGRERVADREGTRDGEV